MPNLEDIIDPTTAMNMALALMAKAFKLNYSTPTNNNHRISSNPHNRQIAQPGMNLGQDRQMQMVGGNGGNQFKQYAWQNVRNLNSNANQNPNGNGNLVATRAEGNATGHNGNQIRCYNCRGVSHFARNCTVRPKIRDDTYLQTQLLIVQKEEAGEFDLMAAVADLDEIKEVNANCILMANLQQVSTSGTQTDKAPIYDSDGSAEVHNYENCYDNEIFNMFTQEDQYTELLEPIPEPHQVPQNDNNVILEVSCVEQSRRTVEQHPANVEETRALYDSLYNNLAIEVEKVNTVNRKLSETNAKLTTELARYKNQESSGKQIMTLNEEISDLNKRLSVEKSIVSSLLEEKKKLKADFKIREDELLDKQIQLEKRIKELDNILVKTGQSIQTIHMLSPKPDSFYHTEQKMALGYQNLFYLKQAQQKQQSLYDGKVLFEKHDPLVVHDSEKTLQLAQVSRQKMKQLNKEIKPANYTKINHLSGVFVSQMAKSHEELYFSNTSKMANVSKPISIPNKEFSDETTPSVARKFLNEVKSTIVTLQCVVKQIMTLETHNWSSSAHQELQKIVKDEIFPIVNQVDARVQNFEIQLLKEAAKFVGDFKSLEKEADESLAKHKALELEIERLLRAVVSQDITSVVQNNYVDETSNLQTELERTKERFKNCIIKKENEYAKLWNDWYKKCEECKFEKISYDKAYNDMQQKIERLQAQLGDLKDNTKTRRPQPRSNTKNDRVPSVSKSSQSKNKEVEVEEHHRKLLLFRNKKHMSSECNNVKLATQNVKSKVVCDMCKQCLNSVNHDFLGSVRIGNDHAAAILGFGDLQWGNILITSVYFVEGLGHNLFLVGQFCDLDLEVTFRRNACFIRNLKGVDLLSGNCLTNLYTINLHEMAYASPICLMARASSTKSWLWHQHLSHLNFDTINDLAKNDLVSGLLKFKYHKEHLCPSCEQGKSKRASHPPKPVPNSRQSLHLLHMDLCGPMRIASINGKRYVLVIVDDYSRYIWVHFIRSKGEAPEVNKTFLKRITILLQSPVIIIRTDNGIEFKNQVLKEYFDSVGISHQNDREDIGKLGAKGLDLTYALSTITTQQPTEGELDLLFEAMYDDYIGGQPSTAPRTVPAAQAHQVRQTLTTSTSIADTAPTPTNSSSQATNFPNTSRDVDGLNSQQHAQQQGNQDPIQPKIVADNVSNAMFDANTFVNPFDTPSTKDVYVCQPEGFIDADHLSHVFKLKKALYGLKQAPRAWRFVDDIFVVQVYVDDIIFGSTHPRYTKLFSDLMKSRFEISMMGEMMFFLGLQVNQSPCGIFINQSNYLLEILKKYGMKSCDPVGTPMKIKDKLDLDQNETPVDATKYRSMIGALMYLTSSRPDIVHATCLCARYQAKPTEKHLKEVKRIFRYLQGTVNMGLWYTKDSGFELTGFLDADYARCKDTFKSTFSEAQFLGENLVSWSSKKQDCMALLTVKAEYVSLSACCAQVL
nr:uncharacterized mitochondrial protein AtMg00810-like [Tanacetum cinerariifolium]